MLGVIELKKWANPKMIDDKGSIANAYKKFKRDFPNLSYLFVSLRFKNKKTQKGGNWEELSKKLVTDGSFCFLEIHITLIKSGNFLGSKIKS